MDCQHKAGAVLPQPNFGGRAVRILSQQPSRAGNPTGVSEEDLAHPLGSGGAAERTHPNFCGWLYSHLVSCLWSQ